MAAYISLIRSTLEYSSVIWDPYLQKDIDKLENVQRRAARSISENWTSRDHGYVTQMMADFLSPTTPSQKEGKPLGILLQGGRGAGAGTADP